MKRSFNQKGFAAFEAVLIIVAIAAVGAAGYFAYQARQDKTDYTVTIPHMSKQATKKESAQSTDSKAALQRALDAYASVYNSEVSKIDQVTYPFPGYAKASAKDKDAPAGGGYLFFKKASNGEWVFMAGGNGISTRCDIMGYHDAMSKTFSAYFPELKGVDTGTCTDSNV